MKEKINIANVVTASRILFALLILLMPAFSPAFYGAYLLGALTDMIDGTIARVLHQQSPFGAKLDTLADLVFVFAVMAKLAHSVHISVWLWIWAGLITIIKAMNLISGFVRHGRFMTEHTLLNKITGGLLFLLPITMGIRGIPWQALAVQCILTCTVATAASIQEGYDIRRGKEVI